MQLFDLRVANGFLLSLKWIPTAFNAIADAIPQPSRESIIRLYPDAFQAVWNGLGPFTIDLWRPQCPPSASPGVPVRCRFLAVRLCGVIRRRRVGARCFARRTSFGFRFLSPVMSGHIAQHVVECEARAVIVVDDTRAYWFPLVQGATVLSREVVPKAA